LYCEKAKCRESCPIGKTAECIAPPGVVNKNDIKLNVCECSPGYMGYYCDEKIVTDFR